MAKIIVAGVDPSLTNFGLAKFSIDLDTFEEHALTILRVGSEKGNKGTKIRQNSDDLRRASELYCGVREFVSDCELVFAEIPSGAQSARAALAFGIVTGIMGAIQVTSPIIQVMPAETKKLGVGIKNAAKEDVMEWAYARYPDLPWETRKLHGEARKTDNNEHCADACAIVRAGIQTDEFKRTAVMLRSMRKSPLLATA